ncbi:Avirulence (Avh) protein, partial [Phytophthora megakarya]
IGKLKTLFQKFPVLNKYKDQIGKGSDLNKMKTAAMKDPEIVKLKNTVGKIQLTNQDATKVRSFASKHPQIANILFSTIIILAAFGILGVLPATLIALAITPHQ